MSSEKDATSNTVPGIPDYRDVEVQVPMDIVPALMSLVTGLIVTSKSSNKGIQVKPKFKTRGTNPPKPPKHANVGFSTMEFDSVQV
ncbi:hypothetical protein JTE90_022997 [Oedothorax gibbosus]|uniref:Uncharacterized protein n=1 Tax=Oedothorax gibbosus TaxID=931172 RepID=A0AAV6V9U7_9ARAC|nr:hypothetical protein JTE90_022997 [Oedothorax gibbosus]